MGNIQPDKKKQHRNHLKRSFAFFRTILGGLFCRMFHYRYDSLKEIPGPYLLLSNHTTEFDPIFLGLAAHNQIRFVASEHIMRKGIGTWFLTTFFDPIIHRKGKDGANTAIKVLSCLKSGESVMVFPEGNRTFSGVTMPIPEANGKMARVSGASLVTYRLEGGFFVQPRFSVKRRKGRITGHLMHVYTPEELKKMTPQEVQAHIVEDLYEDAYLSNRKNPVRFTGRNLAVGIESTLFCCPACKAFGTLSSAKNTVSCNACGFHGDYGTNGLIDAGKEVYTLTELDQIQKKELEKRFREAPESEIFFEDTITVREIVTNHQVERESTEMLRGGKRSIFLGEREISWEEVKGLTVYSRNSISLFLGKDEMQKDLRGDIGFNALKYYYLYRLVKEGIIR